MQLHGLAIDLVHLRSESYSDASRIPTIEIGTPLQDAERRDFTINALFYNLQTRAVEDFTQQGLQDLKDGVIRTPLDADVTFLDGARCKCTALVLIHAQACAPARLAACKCAIV